MFNHSVKVPRLYKDSAKIVQVVIEQNDSVKNVLYQKNSKFANINGIYALVCQTLQHASQLDSLLNSTKLLTKEPRLDPWLARVLITELLWGKQRISGESKPVQTILSYKNVLSMHLETVSHPDEATDKVQIPRYVRINRLHMSPVEAIDGFRGEGWTLVRSSRDDYSSYLSTVKSLANDQFTVDIHFPDVLVFPPKTHFFDYSCYKDGSIILQNKASYIPVFLLNPTPGSVVMDMCAAPGLKTSHMAQLMNNEGIIYAVEKDMERYESLRNHLDVTWATCVKTINRDSTTLTSQDCPDVEYILVDPSCSGSGMMNRIDVNGLDNQVDLERLEKLSGFQITILRHALLNFPNAKRVVYSTCSIYPQENEFVIQEIIKGKGCDHFKLVSPVETLKNKWFHYGNEDDYPGIGGKCLYARPEFDYTNGFFVAVFERKSEEEIFQDRLNNKKLSRNVKTEEQCSPDDNYEDFQSTDTNVNIKKEKTKLNDENSTDEQLKVGNTKFKECDYNVKSEKSGGENANIIKKSKKLTEKIEEMNALDTEIKQVDIKSENFNVKSESNSHSKKKNIKTVADSEIYNGKTVKKDLYGSEKYENILTVQSTNIESNFINEDECVDRLSQNTDRTKKQKKSETVEDSLKTDNNIKKENGSVECILKTEIDPSRKKCKKLTDANLDESTELTENSEHADRYEKIKQKKVKHSKITNEEDSITTKTIKNEDNDSKENIPIVDDILMTDIDKLIKKEKRKKRKSAEDYEEKNNFLDSEKECRINEFIGDPVVEVSSSYKRKNKETKYEVATTFDQNENVSSELIVNDDNITKKKKKHKKNHEETEIEHVVEAEVKTERKSKKKRKRDNEEPNIGNVEMQAEVKSERKIKKKRKRDNEEPDIEHVEMETDVKSERKSKRKQKGDFEEPEIGNVVEADVKNERKSKKKQKGDFEESEIGNVVETNVKHERKSKRKQKGDFEEPEIGNIVEADVKSYRKSKKKHRENHEEPNIDSVEVEADVKSERKSKKKRKKDNEEPNIEHVEMETDVKSERKSKKKHRENHEEPNIGNVEVQAEVKCERKSKKKHKRDHKEPKIEAAEAEADVKSDRKNKKHKRNQEEPEIEHVEVEADVKSERKNKKKHKGDLEVPEIGNVVEANVKSERKSKKKHKKYQEEPEVKHVEVEADVKSERKNKKKHKGDLEVPEIGNVVEADVKSERKSQKR